MEVQSELQEFTSPGNFCLGELPCQCKLRKVEKENGCAEQPERGHCKRARAPRSIPTALLSPCNSQPNLLQVNILPHPADHAGNERNSPCGFSCLPPICDRERKTYAFYGLCRLESLESGLSFWPQ